MNLDDLQVYQISIEIGEKIWNIVKKWNYFERDTVGKQLVRAIDSVSANISEGFGRFHYKESKNFYYYSRGSLFESKTWLEKAHNRGLISDKNFDDFKIELNKLGIKLNNYINSIGKKQKSTINDNK
ncbi:MAG: four helix bundle protein [Candidatus Marinimicrobia bacterium]|nr:four helix bundle protein [Candidatus Neomarinimicrobiota bacterium]